MVGKGYLLTKVSITVSFIIRLAGTTVFFTMKNPDYSIHESFTP